MGFADIIFIFYILLGLGGLYLLWLWVRAYISTWAVPEEKQKLMAAVATLLVGLLWLSYAFKINHWRNTTTDINTPISAETNPLQTEELLNQPTENLTDEQKLARFEQENFPELYSHRTALYREIRALAESFTKIKQVAPTVPKQIPFLTKIYQLRQDTHTKYSQRYLEVSQQLRNFWVHYSTGNSEDVLAKFQPIVTRLIKSIQQIRGDDIDNQNQERKLITETMRSIEASLKNNKLPSPQLGITTYKADNRQRIIDWLTKSGSENVLQSLTMLTNQRAHIYQQIQTVKNYMQRYPDLPLGRTLQLWQIALQHNFYAEYRLLNAVEIIYTLEQLGIEAPAAASAHLDSTIEAQVPVILEHVNSTVTQAEQAYAPTTPKTTKR